MARPKISVTIVALNEGHQIDRAIQSVSGWADDIVVIDAGSADDTVSVAEKSGARVIRNPWPGYGQQKNFAQSKALHPWVLNLDADEQASPELKREIDQALEKRGDDTWGYQFPRRNHYLGRWMRFGGWYPDRVLRFAHREHAAWTEPEVHETLQVRGSVAQLEAPLLHYGFNSIHDQIETNARYSSLGAKALQRQGRTGSRIRLVIKPLGKFLETYFLKRGFLDGLPGFIISVNAAYSMFMKYAYLLESDLTRPPEKDYLNDAHPHH